ncbi:hypothetical protein FA95DRAFT_1604866 [Auriscalpium vulgare]|uniref:Uncharacterized protein n=1 Tax=Auriscalpium vulgare TaxID=40419 RepID=A0ACB8RXB5_9AGAM|nr:hypothetical protein FA95DRAFT_1604866 [Auriscalpium vulgare]
MTMEPMTPTDSQFTLVDRDVADHDGSWLRTVVERIVADSHRAFADRAALETEVTLNILALARQELAKPSTTSPIERTGKEPPAEIYEETRESRLRRREELVGWREEELEWKMKHVDRREEHAKLRDENARRRDTESMRREKEVSMREAQLREREAELKPRHDAVLALQTELEEKGICGPSARPTREAKNKADTEALAAQEKEIGDMRAKCKADEEASAKREAECAARLKVVEAQEAKNKADAEAAENALKAASAREKANEAKQVQLNQIVIDIARQTEEAERREVELAKRELEAGEREESLIRRQKEMLAREARARVPATAHETEIQAATANTDRGEVTMTGAEEKYTKDAVEKVAEGETEGQAVKDATVEGVDELATEANSLPEAAFKSEIDEAKKARDEETERRQAQAEKSTADLHVWMNAMRANWKR